MKYVCLEDQVCSLELAKKLKELGVLQGGAFDYYENTLHPKDPFIVLRPTVNVMEQSPNWICSAFTVAELANLVSCSFEVTRYKDNKWYVCDDGDTPMASSGYDCNTLADALAKMLIYLIEKGIVKS